MKKYSWIVALLLALSLAFIACPSDDKDDGPPPVDPTLQDLVIDGADIVLKYCGNNGKAAHVDGNKFILVEQDNLDNVGFYWEFPEAAVGKGYGAINVEMEVISIENPNFIGFMTHNTSSINNGVNVLDKKTGQQKTGQYDHEFKLGVECEKGAEGDTAEGGDGILDGSSAVGVKHDESYPFAKFTNVIAFQVNKYAGNITTPTWSASTGKATFTIAVTKVTFVGGAVPDSVVDVKAITGIIIPAAGQTPTATVAGTQYTGAVTWAEALDANGKFVLGTEYTATITLTAKEGFTFTGVTENFFTVAGATTVTNAANSGVVTAKFPAAEEPPPALTVTVGGVEKQTTSLTGHKGTVTLLNDGSGVEFTAATGADTAYDWSYFVFKLDLGEALTEFTGINFTVTGTTYKEVWVRAGNADISGYNGSTAEAVLFINSGTNTLAGDPDLELEIDAEEAEKATGTDLFFAIDVRIGSGDTITVKDIAFVK